MKKIFLLVIVILSSYTAKSVINFDFSSICSTGQTLYYKIYNNTVGVTYPNFFLEYHNYYSGYSNPGEHLVIPDSVLYNNTWYHVNYITDHAFQNCSGLTSITIPNSVTSIGVYAFEGCNNITTLNWNAKNCTTYNSAFANKSSITSVTIGDSVEVIPIRFLSGCTGLTSVTIPNSVTSIGNYAFYGCSGLTSVTIPNSVTSIGSYAFDGCTSLTSVTIGNSVTRIGNYAFYGCSGLTTPNTYW